MHGGSGVSFGVIEALRAVHPQLKELELVHRLDRETSGCLLVAKRRAVLRDLHAQLREREMEKRYLALVAGRWPFGAKTIDLPLKTNLKQGGERVVRVHSEGQHAVTTFKPIEQFGKVATLLDVDLGTGRTHQIRVHAAHAGYPVAGDEKYGDREKDAKLKAYGLSRMFLHAASLTFRRGEEPFTATAPLPPELAGSRSTQLRRAYGTVKPCLRSTGGQPDQRQADERGRVVRVHLVEQRNAERFDLEAAGAVVRLVARHVATDLLVAEATEVHRRDVEVPFVRAAVREHDVHGGVEHDAMSAQRFQLRDRAVARAGLAEHVPPAHGELVGADHEAVGVPPGDDFGLGARQPPDQVGG